GGPERAAPRPTYFPADVVVGLPTFSYHFKLAVDAPMQTMSVRLSPLRSATTQPDAAIFPSSSSWCCHSPLGSAGAYMTWTPGLFWLRSPATMSSRPSPLKSATRTSCPSVIVLKMTRRSHFPPLSV